jgi:hypothetical protein
MNFQEIIESGAKMFRPTGMKEATYFISPLGIIAFEYLVGEFCRPKICYPNINTLIIGVDWEVTPEDFNITDFLYRDEKWGGFVRYLVMIFYILAKGLVKINLFAKNVE